MAHRRSAKTGDERGHGQDLAVGRREFIRLAVEVGIALPSLSAMMAACDGEQPHTGERSDDARADVNVLAATPGARAGDVRGT